MSALRSWVHRYARRRLRLIPDPILYRIASPSRRGLIAWLRERKLLWVFHHYPDAMGMAANQVGSDAHILVATDGAGGAELVVHNPVVEVVDTQRERMYEQCFSIPGGFVEVERPVRVVVHGVDSWGRRLPPREATGMLAVVVQHECDHLNGVLITDYGEFVSEDEYRALVEAGEIEELV